MSVVCNSVKNIIICTVFILSKITNILIWPVYRSNIPVSLITTSRFRAHVIIITWFVFITSLLVLCTSHWSCTKSEIILCTNIFILLVLHELMFIRFVHILFICTCKSHFIMILFIWCHKLIKIPVISQSVNWMCHHIILSAISAIHIILYKTMITPACSVHFSIRG